MRFDLSEDLSLYIKAIFVSLNMTSILCETTTVYGFMQLKFIVYTLSLIEKQIHEYVTL